jgi:hypothetical protein
MPWILGYAPETIAVAPGASCSALVSEPHEATIALGNADGAWVWEKPNRLVHRVSLRAYERGSFTLAAPSAKGERYAARRAADAIAIADQGERRSESYTFNGAPAPLEQVMFDAHRTAALPDELKHQIESGRANGTLSLRPEQLARDVAREREVSGHRETSLAELAQAWDKAYVDPDTGRRRRCTTWEVAWRDRLVDDGAVGEHCALCAGGRAICLRRVWIDATGMLELERFLALALDVHQPKSELNDIFARFPRKVAKGLRSKKTPLAQRYFKGMKKFFHLMPVSENEEAQAMMATLFFGGAPDVNELSVETCDRWVRELGPFVEAAGRLREELTSAVGEEEAEPLLDQVEVLRELVPYMRASKPLDRPLPLVFAAR